jgi:hypothetical protein
MRFDTTCRDTYPVFLGQLQRLSSLSSGPHSLGQLEGRRISALLRLIQAAISVAGVTPDQLTTDKQNGIVMLLYIYDTVLVCVISVTCIPLIAHTGDV